MQSYFFSIIEKLVNWLQLWVKNRKCFIVNKGAKRHLFRVIEALKNEQAMIAKEKFDLKSKNRIYTSEGLKNKKVYYLQLKGRTHFFIMFSLTCTLWILIRNNL
jgi:hypothetical protein